jgi:hypothetical protein
VKLNDSGKIDRNSNAHTYGKDCDHIFIEKSKKRLGGNIEHPYDSLQLMQ